jgi:hypothetical protein
MRIPDNPIEREQFYVDLMNKCNVSTQERSAEYAALRSFFLFGSNMGDAPAHYNKIFPHIDQLISFLYSAESTRFSIDLGAAVPNEEYAKVPILTKALNDEWTNSNADQMFSQALTWAMCYNTAFIKLTFRNGIHPFMVEPQAMGVLREDTPYTYRQEAVCQKYYITKSELYNRLYAHPKRDELIKRLSASYHERDEVPQAIDRLVTSQISPNIYGNVMLDLTGYNRYVARVAEPTIEMNELWVWNDATDDYQCVTIGSPNVIIYDRPGEKVFLKGELPFVQVCPNPQYDYYWGQSEVQRLVFLQEMRNKRVSEILDLLSKQVAPPTALMGFTGILDEKNFALNRAAGLLATDMPNAKVEQLAPSIPNDLFREIVEIDNMFAEASGITSVLSGRGEAGVRSSGHASQLARLGSSRAKKRALVVEESLEKVATLYLKMMQVYDDTHYTDLNENRFIAAQLPENFVVKVDAHSNSPIFMEDTRDMALSLFNAGAISKERLIDLLDPPMKQLLKEDLKKMEEQQAQMATMQQAMKQEPTPPEEQPIEPEMP